LPPTSAAETIRDLAGPLVDALGCRLYDVEMSGSGRQRTVRVLIDRDGGVDLDVITAATRAISPALDDAPGLSGPYLLEVSSPGLERPLRRAEHYAAAVGQTVTISYHTEAGPRRARGVLRDAGADHCVVDVDGEREDIAYDAVTKARTVFEWGPPPRPPKGAKARGRAKERT
jgi:ribosome maturation factor RimP